MFVTKKTITSLHGRFKPPGLSFKREFPPNCFGKPGRRKMKVFNLFVFILGLFVSSCAGDRPDIGERAFSVVLNADHTPQKELVDVVKNSFGQNDIILRRNGGTEWFVKFIHETPEVKLIVAIIDPQIKPNDPKVVRVVAYQRESHTERKDTRSKNMENIFAAYRALSNYDNIVTQVYFDKTTCWRLTEEGEKIVCNKV